MKRQQEKERYDRLSFKTLDLQFQQEAIDGLSCSPLEAKALTEIVKEVFFREKRSGVGGKRDRSQSRSGGEVLPAV